MKIFIRLYDFFHKHRRLCFSLLALCIAFFVFLTKMLEYNEDIYDFLPIDDNYRKELSAYQKISQAERIVVVFEMRDTSKIDTDKISDAIEIFEQEVSRAEVRHFFTNLTTTIDYDQIFEKTDYIYSHIPYFLTEKDYDRLDTILTANYIHQHIENDKDMLLFPTGSFLSDNIGRDPLNLFSPTVSRIQNLLPALSFDISDGHIFSEDSRKAYAFFSTPNGASETSNNEKLSQLLDIVMQKVEAAIPDVKLHSVGAPIIAVGNANQIKRDSMLAIAISICFILALLLYSLRSLKSLFFIIGSILVGWLFAMAGISLIHDSVSFIVLGIASVIIGIAVNYPLHFVAHLRHEPNVRQALRELISPLIIGNITTVGAFLCLVPLDSIAMRDLGLFGSFMLIGTILFVIIFLPHFCKSEKTSHPDEKNLLYRLANVSLDSKWLMLITLLLTCVFGYFSFGVSFDADLSHINYMTDDQRKDLLEIQGKLASQTTQPVYVISEDITWDGAILRSENAQSLLHNIADSLEGIEKNNLNTSITYNSITDFIPSKAMQQQRVERWQRFISENHDLLTVEFDNELQAAGFVPSAFEEFNNIITAEYTVIPEYELQSLASELFSTFVFHDSITTIVDVLNVPLEQTQDVVNLINHALPDCHAFDVKGMNSAMANALSDDFNFIGYSCALIVFFFLWLSFGNIELAALAFLPMAVSWLWILGIMHILGIQFNIVNIILATFIFGQGDDYTIFITEGLIYEYAYRKKMLATYKNGIIISALIMFIGIGSLIVAKHPALHSLATVTIVGMFSVVLMACMIPTYIFRWLTTHKGKKRERPISLWPAIKMAIFKISGLSKHWLPINYKINGDITESIKTPKLIVCNHQSKYDNQLLHLLSDKIIPIGISTKEISDYNKLKKLISKGYSIAIFPEGVINNKSSILRFQEAAFRIAKDLRLDIQTLFIHGANHVLPASGFGVFQGTVNFFVGDIFVQSEKTYHELAENTYNYFVEQYELIRREYENLSYFQHFVLDQYRYKGHSVFVSARRAISGLIKLNVQDLIIEQGEDTIYTKYEGQGENVVLLACIFPNRTIKVLDESDDEIGKVIAQDFSNIEFT